MRNFKNTLIWTNGKQRDKATLLKSVIKNVTQHNSLNKYQAIYV